VSNLTEPLSPGRPSGPSRGAVALVVVTLGLLAALVWGLNPSRPHFTPAPLEPPTSECPKLKREFIPTNATYLGNPSLDALPREKRNRALYRLNMEACTCGCSLSIAGCRLANPACETSKTLANKIIAAVQAETEKKK